MDDLARAVYIRHDEADNTLQLIARSDGVTLQGADTWRENALVSLRPNDPDKADSIGVVRLYDGSYVVAQAQWTGDSHDQPRYIYTHIPPAMMRGLSGHFDAVLVDVDVDDAMPSLALLQGKTCQWTVTSRASLIQNIIDHELLAWDDLLWWLNAALMTERLLILNHDGSMAERFTLVKALIALLPPDLRADLTFSTEAHTAKTQKGRIIFSNATETSRRVYDWSTRQWLQEMPPVHPYVSYLADQFTGDLEALLQDLDGMNNLFAPMNRGADLILSLGDAVRRYRFHQYVESSDEVLPSDLADALLDGHIPAAWNEQYAAMLLPYALESRNSEWHSLLARKMDSNPAIDAQLETQLQEALNDTPDLVYAFARQRLSEGIEPNWLRRLHMAAEKSLGVALHDGGSEFVQSWLRLLAREPEAFELTDILFVGFRQAVIMAYDDGEFGYQVLLLAARFFAPILHELLDDAKFIAALPEHARRAFIDYDHDSIVALQNDSTSLFLLCVGQAVRAQISEAIDPAIIQRVWAVANGEKRYNSRLIETPNTILQWLTRDTDWLSQVALESMLAQIVVNRDSGFFAPFTTHLAEKELLAEYLIGAFFRLPTNNNLILDTVSILTATERLTLSDAVTVYATLLEESGWTADSLPILQALARILNQNPDLTAPVLVLESMLQTSATHRDESTAKPAALRLLNHAITYPEPDKFVERVTFVFQNITWGDGVRAATLQWWRDYLQQQPTPQLSQLAGDIAGVRVLDDALTVLHSVMAMRRLLGDADTVTLVERINNAYQTLETLSDAFDSFNDSDNPFDPQTARDILGDTAEDLTPQQRQIFANSLKGMATLVISMNEKRTRPGIGRPAEKLDRQLITGEQSPQSAVDALKWMSGFFGGSQTKRED